MKTLKFKKVNTEYHTTIKGELFRIVNMKESRGMWEIYCGDEWDGSYYTKWECVEALENKSK